MPSRSVGCTAGWCGCMSRHPAVRCLRCWTSFLRSSVLELAAASLHGEQAVANLFKVRQMAADLADRPNLTLNGFVSLMLDRLTEQPEEAESALSEDTLDAVRVLTIHKAKGLEFPLVILAGLHHGDGAGRGPARPLIWHDWSTGVQGLDLGDRAVAWVRCWWPRRRALVNRRNGVGCSMSG